MTTAAANSSKTTNSSSNHASLSSAAKILEAAQEPVVESQCRSCVQLLQQVLLASDSKPSQLLASLFATTDTSTTANTASTTATRTPSRLRWRQATRGVDVEIPVPPTVEPVPAVSRRLSVLHPPEQDEIASSKTTLVRRTAVLTTAEQQLATSAVSTGASTNTLQQQEQPPFVPTEWMTIRCQPCKMTGPEGGARAFVMGPTPLSIVVCTNRLKHLQSRNSAAARDEMDEILTHELVHVHDVRQLQLDLRDCESLAYSEVRAARDAECRKYSDQTTPAPAWYTLGYHQPTRRTCASQTALAATSNLFPSCGMAQTCVDKVFERAFGDVRPFTRRTTNQSVPRKEGS